MKTLTVAICTYNRASNLPRLVDALRKQTCPVPFEILVIDNNSSDHTQQVLNKLAALDGPLLRSVLETRQGIVYARNRAIEEAINSTYLAFIDDDELPGPTWLSAAIDALDREEAECVGGEIRVSFPSSKRPAWLEDDLLPFLGEVNNGPAPFWIRDGSTPVWSGNVAYQTSIFFKGLRFDHRYNREKHSIGGGSDEVLFLALLNRGVRIRYRPDMLIEHLVDKKRLKRSYFITLHFKNGSKRGLWSQETYGLSICGIPPFMVVQSIQQLRKAIPMLLVSAPGAIREAMISAHSLGMITGRFERWGRGIAQKESYSGA